MTISRVVEERARLEGLERTSLVAAVADVEAHQLEVEPGPDRRQAGQQSWVLEVRREHAVAGLPVQRPERKGQAFRGRVRQDDVIHVRSEDCRDHRAGLVHPLAQVIEPVWVGSTHAKVPVRELRHQADGLPRQGAGRRGVQVDPRARGRQLLADGRELLVIGEKGGGHGSV